MNIAEWILVIMLAVALFIFLVAGIVLLIKLIHLAGEAERIIETGQGIAAKADDIVDNVKGMTSVGGIVKTFANHVIDKQERRYAAEDAAEEAAEASRRAAAAAEEAATKQAIADAAAETVARAKARTVRKSTSTTSAKKTTKK